jgi:hypothetical protein
MSKRTRGARRGQHRSRRPPGAARRPTGLSPAGRPPSQLEVATEIAEDLVEEQPQRGAEKLLAVADSTPERRRERATSLLAAKAAAEYVYVIEDVRRIVLVAGMLFAVMFLFWVLIVALRIIPI